jgi:hypothetical protein
LNQYFQLLNEFTKAHRVSYQGVFSAHGWDMKQDPVYYKAYYERTKERKLALGSEWYRKQMADELTKELFKNHKNECQRIKYANDPRWRARIKYKKLLQRMLRGHKYPESVVWNLVGCTIGELKSHLESQFTSCMSWDNFGLNGWVVDHIIPCCRFDLTEYRQRHECFHYTNLQPMWYEVNRKKSITYASA